MTDSKIRQKDMRKIMQRLGRNFDEGKVRSGLLNYRI